MLVAWRVPLPASGGRFPLCGYRAAQGFGHAGGNRGLGLLDAGYIFEGFQPAAHFLGLDARPFCNGINLSPEIHRNECAAIPLGEGVAAFSQGACISFSRVGLFPASLKQGFEGLGVLLGSLGLFPFGSREVQRIALFAVSQPARHGPAMFTVQLAGDVLQLALEVRQVDYFHALGIDPRPDDMRMAAAFFLMKDDGTRLALQAQFLFCRLDGRFKSFR